MPKSGCSSYSVSSTPGHILKINWGRPALQRALSVCWGRAGSAGEFLSLVLPSCRPRVPSKLKNNMARGQVPPSYSLDEDGITALLCSTTVPADEMFYCYHITSEVCKAERSQLPQDLLSHAQLPMVTLMPHVTCPKALPATGIRPDTPRSISGWLR